MAPPILMSAMAGGEWLTPRSSRMAPEKDQPPVPVKRETMRS
jgi:hypothetical protein